jgi:tetratricopeptide (TPR) repeat protein
VPWQVFAEFGAIGFVALIGLIIGAARAIWRLLRGAQDEEQTWIVWVSAGLAGYAAQNLVDDQTHVLAVMVPLMLVLALAVGAHPVEQVNNLSYSVRRGRVPLASIGLPLFVLGVLQAQWLWAYAAFDQARLVYGADDAARALTLTQEAARRDAALPFYDVEVGLLAARLDDWPAAQAHFERAARREGSLAFVWANLGVARWRNGDQSGGLAALQSAAQIAPASPTILLTAGGMAEAAGQPEAADVYYRATLALQPDWADRPFWGQTEVRMNARAAVPLPAPDPNDPYLKARAALTLGRVAEARSWMDVGLGDPNYAPRRRVEWQMLLGDVLLAEGDEAGAMNQYTGALAAFANPSIEGTGYAFWNTYGFWLYHREPFPFDSVPGLLPLDVTPEMLARFERLSRWLREQGSCAEALAVDRQRLRLDSSSITSSSCP